MSELAATLRRLREAARLTQEELGDRAGVSARTISDTERGLRTRIYADTARRLAAALGLDGADAEEFVRAARGRTGREPASSGLPHPLTPIIGRHRELALLTAELRPDGGRRLVTVTGLGGCGKTRLAIAAGEVLLPAYQGRVRMVPLAALHDADRLLDVVASALGTAAERIPAAVADRPTLLVLDAFEHVLPATGRLTDLLLASATLHVLVTSRTPLGVAGERELPLGPLDAEDAARLFAERARDLNPNLPDDPSTIAEICELLSGLPLPIELSAAQVRHLPLGLLRDQLRSGLGDAGRVVDDAVAWAMGSLSDEDRHVLSSAAVFVGGWELDALQRLCEDVDVIQCLGRLAEKSLIALDAAGPVPRWRMLDVVREAAARIEPVDRGRRKAYTRYYLDLLGDANERIGHEQMWFRTLAVEEPNVQTALGWAEADGDADTLLALATGMWLFWQTRGGLEEGRTWLARGLDMQPAAAVALRRDALWGLAWLAYHQGDDGAAAAAGDELAALAEECADDVARRNALTIGGMVAIARDRSQAAVELLTGALAIARGLERPWILAASLLNVGLANLAAGAPDQARPFLGEALHRYDDIGDLRFRARCIGYLALAALLDADPDRAKALFRQSLAAFRDVEEPAGIAEGLAGLAAVEAGSRPAVAATLAGAASRVRETVAARELPLERRIAARYLGAAAESLGTDAWQAAWDRGRRLPTDDVITDALA